MSDETRYWDSDQKAWAIFIVAFGIFIICAIIVGIKGAIISNHCLTHGYPQSQFTFPAMRGYCIKRVNQTDVVIPEGEWE